MVLPIFGTPRLEWDRHGSYSIGAGLPRPLSRQNRCDQPLDRTDHPFQPHFHLPSSIACIFSSSSLIFTPSSRIMDQRQFGDSINSDERLGQQGRAQGRAQAGRPVDAVSDDSEQGQPPTAPYDQNQSGTFWHHQVSFQEPLPYAHSPVSFSSPSTSSVEQSALGEPSQWSAFTPLRSHT